MRFLTERLLLSGRRGSNPPPIAWKAIALPNELLPLMVQKLFSFYFFCGDRWIRTTEGISQQIYSLPHLATLVYPLTFLSAKRFTERVCKSIGFFYFCQTLKEKFQEIYNNLNPKLYNCTVEPFPCWNIGVISMLKNKSGKFRKLTSILPPIRISFNK